MAISKSRLQELINKKDYFISKEELVACNKNQTAIDCVIKLSKLFETQKEAEDDYCEGSFLSYKRWGATEENYEREMKNENNMHTRRQH